MSESIPTQVPVIDISPILSDSGELQSVGNALKDACYKFGFFYIKGHGVSESLQDKLESLSHQFFVLPLEEKMKIPMSLGGRAWRGFFPVGGELTSGKPDLKEGLYFGTELSSDHPKVQTETLLHGSNLFPDSMPEFRDVVLTYMEALTHLGHHLMRGFSVSLGLEEDYFANRFTTDPLTLFRIFHYPPQSENNIHAPWGVGEHTDYGLLTILKQDRVGGLQIKSRDRWIDAPYIPGTFICNIGDMLDRMTKGFFRSTPHRVQNVSNQSRFSFPFFFDPNFDAQMEAIPLDQIDLPPNEKYKRWDGLNVHEFSGTYGDYVLGKVSKVFPELRNEVGNE